MRLRPHESDPKLTIATYPDGKEAQKVATQLAPFYKKIPYRFGIVEAVDIRKDDSVTVLDDGQIEMTHRTTRLARFLGQLSRETASRLNYQPKELSSYTKEQQHLADTINQYLSDRTTAIPTRPETTEPELTPQELARAEAFKKIKQPYEKTFTASVVASLYGVTSVASGRVVESFSVNPNIPDHVNETVRQIGNDLTYAGVASAALGLVVALGIIKGEIRSEKSFDAGWNEANSRLDPNGQVEAPLQAELLQAQEPLQ
jgi:hypothetical protein